MCKRFIRTGEGGKDLQKKNADLTPKLGEMEGRVVLSGKTSDCSTVLRKF